MWACGSADVVPDLMCVAKGISGGYLPLAATLATEEVYAAFLGSYEAQKTFFHGHTYTGNPLACAVAIASLDLFEKERILERSRSRIAYLSRALSRLADHPNVGEIRQAGFIVGIELVPERRAPGEVPPEYPWEKKVGYTACLAAREKGVLLRPLGNVMVLNPPLSISESEIDWMIDGAAHGIGKAVAFRPA
jgi:adenosylmethionine-8-amino-7-oxononanoate aminotransferase